jgi:putative sterol carrier protein
MPKVTNPQEVFDAMPPTSSRRKPATLTRTVQIDLSGDGGGQWHAVVADGKLTVEHGAALNQISRLPTSTANFLALVNGELKPMPAFIDRQGES